MLFVVGVLFLMSFVVLGEEKSNMDQMVIADSGNRKLICLNADGTVAWEKKGIYCYDVHRLANGNILYADSAKKKSFVREINVDGKVIFEYKTSGEVFSCQRLDDGKTLVGECTNGKIVEVDKDGKVSKTIKLTFKQGGHGCVFWVRKTLEGTYVAAHRSDKVVREYDEKGKVLREIKCPWKVFGVMPLGKGGLMISGEHGLMEVDKEGKVVWKLVPDDIKEINVKLLAGIYLKSNGNIIQTNWLGHKQEGKGAPLFEVTKDKEVVWKLPASVKTRWIGAIALSK
jgi:hypothetical protein